MMSSQFIREELQNKLYDLAATAFANKDAFVSYRLPGETDNLQILTGKAKDLTSEALPNEAGFIIAPFDKSNPQIKFIKGIAQPVSGLESIAEFYSTSDFYLSAFDHLQVPTDEKKNYQTLVSKAIQHIKNGNAQKIVTSRQTFIEKPESFDPIVTFIKLTQAYPDAFVCLNSTPETGTWICASPEVLVSQSADGMFETVALAGTQPALEGVHQKDLYWTQKEIEEQALVSRYIINCFKQIRLREFKENGPFTAKAGNLMHLKTVFQVNTLETGHSDLLSTMLRLLHPTSAVCGMPHEAAQSFLDKNEGYSRSFYAGYLGPVSQSGSTHLFVNLRNMEVLPTHLRLFAGGGITADSDTEKEWRETEYKIQTLSAFIA